MFHPTLKEPFLFLVLKSFLAFLTLFNFQGTCRLATVFIAYHKSFRLSTTFFRFFNLFRCRAFRLATAHLYYHNQSRLSTSFFVFLKTSFSRPRLSRDSFAILTPSLPFVKPFFALFSAFFDASEKETKAAVNSTTAFVDYKLIYYLQRVTSA